MRRAFDMTRMIGRLDAGDGLGGKALRVLLSVALAVALVPTGAVQALAEELPVEDGEEIIDDTTPLTPEAGEGIDTEEEDSVSEIPAPEPVVSTAPKAKGAPLKAPSPSNVTMTLMYPGDETATDGTYNGSRWVGIQVVPSGVTLLPETPKVTVLYYDNTGTQHIDDITVDEWDTSTVPASCIFELTSPGIYGDFNGNLAQIGIIVQTSAGPVQQTLYFDETFAIAEPPCVSRIALRDGEGNLIQKPDSTDVYDYRVETGSEVVFDASAVEVSLTGFAVDTDDDIMVSKSYAELLDKNGTTITKATFKVDDAAKRTYVAKLDKVGSTGAPLGEGVYAVRVTATDKFGNKAWSTFGEDTYDYVLYGAKMTKDSEDNEKFELVRKLIIDQKDPEVSVTLPTPQGTLTSGGKTLNLYSSETTPIKIELRDYSLDYNNTKVFGVPLSAVVADPTGAVAGVEFDVQTGSGSDGRPLVTLTVTSIKDGIYATPLAVAKDKVASHNEVTDDLVTSGVDYLVIDAAAPAIDNAYIGDVAVSNAEDASNAIRFYKNGGDDGSAADAGNASLTLVVKEPHGIRSVELSDPLGHYVVAGSTVAGELSSGNANTLASDNDGIYTLKVLDTLDDGYELSKNFKVTIYDYTGNYTIWSLAGVTQKVSGASMPASSAAELREQLGGSVLVPTPTLLIEDDIKPVVSMSGPEAGSYISGSATVDLSVVEMNLKYLRKLEGGSALNDPNGLIAGAFEGLDPNRVVVTCEYTAAEEGSSATPSTVTVSELTQDETDASKYTWTRTVSADGDYKYVAKMVDAAGNESNEATIGTFTIDGTAPKLSVSYEDGGDQHSPYFNSTRTATLTVVEHNFDPSKFEVTAQVSKAAQATVAPTASAWTKKDGEKDTYECTIVFAEDGEYHFTVKGADKAGNALRYDDGTTEGAELEGGTYTSETFVIDKLVPEIAPIELPALDETHKFGGKSFYTGRVDLTATITDRNFDATNTTVDGASATWTDSAPDADNFISHTTGVSYDADGEYQTPYIESTDLAGNYADNASDVKGFVIDLEAPTIEVTASQLPVSQGVTGTSDPYNFYNTSTTLTFTVSDAHALFDVVAADPDGVYGSISWDKNPLGETQVTGTVTLRDNASTPKGEYGRDITLTATDVAGNARTWTIDHEGNVTQASGPSAANDPIDSSGSHPELLVQDLTNPVVGLSGVEAGKFYNTPQNVLATVAEYNFDYLTMFDPSRVIVTVTKYEGAAGRKQSSWTIPASGFTGAKPNYTHSEAFGSDGHYVVTAKFNDYAENPSNEATIGEFTIDMTPPQLTMEFDNNDVRNEKYYKATRTATITVVEHNFDPSLFTIETEGSIGAWSDNGDTHTCTVFFGEGGPYTIKVNGKDLAGNAATEVSEPEFIVDLTAPEIAIEGTAQRLGYVGDNPGEGLVNAYHDKLEDTSAYNGVVLPTITYKDNEVLSAADLTHVVSGAKHGDEVELEASVPAEDKEMTVTFRDIGYVGDAAGDGSNWEDFYVDDYAADADDIYTIKASMTDQAGNEAEAELTFSVNRYGSNYAVDLRGVDDEEMEEYKRSGMLSEAPTIVVREVSVSGVADLDEDGNIVPDNHRVEKEFANATRAISLKDGDGDGYDLQIVDPEDAQNGWSEYVYTVRSANFGEGSDSDNNDRGQGVYRVNVMSDDVSSNANTTAEYWSSDSKRTEVTATGATAEFILDELGPTIDELNLPEHLSRGEAYEASFHVTDDITSGNIVEVYVDGKQLPASEVSGPANGAGTFTFAVPASPFNWNRSIKIVVRDYAGRETSERNGTWIWQSTFIPEALLVLGVAAVGVTGVVVSRKRRDAMEPELPV